ncbi:hypothetical protein BW731_07020 [Vagococcus martis]|uniref:N-acetyltransferase domain-containing protein n=1 Tax=Vagococcus martis TaxID=1768210 RepID=A0A1V4DHD3_9ENTE|nr:GNAT family N-acetyltransferase [Vagococcus martis]OPF87937.1 hypothetical protein BW731_07020 [Vagococcus martis]
MILIKPTSEWTQAILDYKTEFLSQSGVNWIDGSSGLSDFINISDWLDHLILYESNETIPNPDFVTGEQYLFIRETDRKIVGMIHFRHELNEYLFHYGGHIGYSVAPSERKKGYASRMLKEMLVEKKGCSNKKLLITCNDDNIESAKVIEHNGGILENKLLDESDNQLVRRYWIDN